MNKHPGLFSYRDFLISMFSLLFSLSGIGMAVTDRQSAIDPLSDEGKKEV